MRSELVRVIPTGLHDEDSPVLRLICFFCGEKEEVVLCNWCRSVYYCRKHHAAHRNRSKCAPFVLQQGQHLKKMLASRDIKPGETILIEKPAIVAPAPSSHPVCVACLARLKNVDEEKCDRCNLPVCSARCQNSEIHKPECRIFAENKVKVKMEANAANDFYTCIAPIRMLALKSQGSENTDDIWQTLMQLPEHKEERFGKSEWNIIEMEVVEFLRNRCFMKSKLSEDELHKYAGIFAINAAAIGNPKGLNHGKALYPIFSTMNHDCVANAKFKIDTNSWDVRIKAQTFIKKGEEITVQYLSTVLGTHKRKKRLKSEWFFDCHCRRCTDPTELETFVSALICEVCEEDYLLPTEPLDVFSPWTCGSCDFFMNSMDAEAKVDTIEDELSAATTKRDLKALENFVQHYSGTILHPNHYLLLLAKRNFLYISRKNLIDLLTKCPVEEQQELKTAFKSKSELFREFNWIPEKLNCAETF